MGVRQKALERSHLQTEAAPNCSYTTAQVATTEAAPNKPASLPSPAVRSTSAGMCRDGSGSSSDGHWTLLCQTRDGITLSCSRLHHRKENLYLLMVLPPFQNCTVSMRRGAQRKLEKKNKKGEMSSGWFLEAAWCPQSASQGMDLCDQILTTRGSTSLPL